MHLVESSIEVGAPVTQCFEVLSHADTYPKFLEKIISVIDRGGNTWHWMSRGLFGRTIEWDSYLTEIIPNTCISWVSERDAAIGNSGTINFVDLGENQCRLMLKMTYSLPGGPIGEFCTDIFGSLDPYIRQSLENFKFMIEDSAMRIPSETLLEWTA